ncbi:MAG: coenzyme F420-0:L-glutamate ligase [Candidatus Bathyarchaeota archaeon]|nr:MAG: coenzyme F420-0:L-glutamate ligase [Candidatus Bathyarchaeota archaeon]
MVKRYKTLAVTTRYWRPRQNYLRQIVDAIENKVENGDIVTISEKAISTALGNIVDESVIKPVWLARLLAKYWMRYVWGYFLGQLCRLRKTTIRHIREYPIKEGSAHKQVALEHAGFLQTLMFGSEGGIDGSNLPYSYVSLPLRNASQIAEKIRRYLESKLGKSVIVMIVDTDKTYSIRGFHFTPRPKSISGIRSPGGFLAYVIGRLFKVKRRATPVAVAGSEMHVEEALEIAEIANRARGFGAGRTVWDMAETFKVSITNVAWDMLSAIEHKPIVIVKAHK